MRYLENRTFDEIKIGDAATIKRTLTQNDITLFSIMSGDINPAHVDVEYAKQNRFHKVVAQGMWGASLFSTVLGTKLPGPGTIYLNQTLRFEHPITLGDTVTVTLTAVNKKIVEKKSTQHIIEFECECVNQDGKKTITGLATVLAPINKIKRKKMILPEIEFKPPKERWYQTLLSSSQGLEPLKTAVVHPVDKLSIKGAVESAKSNLIDPIFVGPAQKILAAALDARVDISRYTLIDTPHSHAAAETAVALARNGQVEALMKGKIHTDELMHAVLDKVNGLRTGRRMSHVFSLEITNYHKPIFLTDAAINLFPNLNDKRDIVQNAIDLFVRLGLGVPKVAILSAVETVSERLPSTLDATALCKMAERGQIQGGILDGPLAFDNAISPQSARVKGIFSSVAGHADILVVPDVESGNMLYKQMTYLLKMEAAGIVLGATLPIILTSRGSDILSRKASCALALVYTRNK